MPFPLLTRLTIENYRSIEKCSVPLRNLNFLVGPNGSGKSNFMDAFAFVAEALSTSLDEAMVKRGGIFFLVHKKHKRASLFGFRLEFSLSNTVNGHYSVQFSGDKESYIVEQEECTIKNETGESKFLVQAGTVLECRGLAIEKFPVSSDRLFLPLASIIPVFQPVHALLSRLAVYDPVPTKMQQLRPVASMPALLGDGSNYGDVLTHLRNGYPELTENILAYMRKVNPLIRKVYTETLEGNLRFVVFAEQATEGARLISSMQASFGTLRSLALLIALFQPASEGIAPVICIEEPETGLHPYASGSIRDALREASELRQIIVSSHSPDLLDDKDISSDSILAVVSRNGSTEIGPLDAGTRSLLQDQLFTAGELLRQNHLKPDISFSEQKTPVNALLFDES